MECMVGNLAGTQIEKKLVIIPCSQYGKYTNLNPNPKPNPNHNPNQRFICHVLYLHCSPVNTSSIADGIINSINKVIIIIIIIIINFDGLKI